MPHNKEISGLIPGYGRTLCAESACSSPACVGFLQVLWFASQSKMCWISPPNSWPRAGVGLWAVVAYSFKEEVRVAHNFFWPITFFFFLHLSSICISSFRSQDAKPLPEIIKTYNKYCIYSFKVPILSNYGTQLHSWVQYPTESWEWKHSKTCFSKSSFFFLLSWLFLPTAVKLRCGRDRNSDVLTTSKLNVTFCSELTPIYLSLMWENNNGQQTGGRARANMLSTAPSFDTTGTHVFPQRL